jgi:hypothetical protein
MDDTDTTSNKYSHSMDRIFAFDAPSLQRIRPPILHCNTTSNKYLIRWTFDGSTWFDGPSMDRRSRFDGPLFFPMPCSRPSIIPSMLPPTDSSTDPPTDSLTDPPLQHNEQQVLDSMDLRWTALHDSMDRSFFRCHAPSHRLFHPIDAPSHRFFHRSSHGSSQIHPPMIPPRSCYDPTAELLSTHCELLSWCKLSVSSAVLLVPSLTAHSLPPTLTVYSLTAHSLIANYTPSLTAHSLTAHSG